MQKDIYLNAVTQDFLDDFRRDYNVELIGKETDEAEDVETACSWNGHQVGYSTARISRITFVAEGFKLHHPNGAIISSLSLSQSQPLRLSTTPTGMSWRTTTLTVNSAPPLLRRLVASAAWPTAV